MDTTTIKRPNWTETSFSKWLREQPEIDSNRQHFSATNLDYMWEGPGMGSWMLIEGKAHLTEPKKWQVIAFSRLHKAIQDPDYRGFHIIQFENETPDDGAAFLDGDPVNRTSLLTFLRFEGPPFQYATTFRTVKATRQESESSSGGFG